MAGQMTLFNLMDDTPDLYKIHNKVRLKEDVYKHTSLDDIIDKDG